MNDASIQCDWTATINYIIPYQPPTSSHQHSINFTAQQPSTLNEQPTARFDSKGPAPYGPPQRAPVRWPPHLPRIGPRLLPIFFALRDAAGFFFVVFVAVGAASHCYYELQLRIDAAEVVEGEWFRPLFEAYTAVPGRSSGHHGAVSRARELENFDLSI